MRAHAKRYLAPEGVEMLHVPFQGGGQAPIEVMAGRVDVLFSTLPTAIENIRAGKLRALAVTTGTRSFALPEVPTVAETVPGCEASDWYGMGAPEGMSAEIVEKLNREVKAVLDDPKVKARFAEMGATVIGSSPADFQKLIVDESRKWERVARFAGAKAD